MALGDKRFTRIPPESTGDRVYMVHTAEIEYKTFNSVAGGSTDHSWKIGQMYMIAGFGGNGMVHVHGVYDKGDGTGVLAVHYNKTAKYENLEPTVDANILYNNQAVAQVAAFYDVYIPTQNIMGFDNPEFGMDVDITGSANVRFAEGLPQLDAWGKLRTSGATQLGDYVFGQEEVFNQNFSPVMLSGGYTTYSNTRHSITIGVDHTVDPANGFASSSSNQYHHYIAGSSHLYAGTALLNSPETTGNIRRWGLFDANNGFFFQLGAGGVTASDTTGFCVCVRSSIPSAPQKDTLIERAEWNGDKLDGTGDSQVTIDLSQVNLWWIDIQWHGAGRVRFGTYIDGQRVVCHSYYQGNEFGEAMSQTTSLPCCFSNKSTAGSATNLYIESWSAAVWTESDVDLRAYGAPATYASPHVAVPNGPSWDHIFSLSPRELHANGEVNHTVYVPTSIKGYAFNVDTGVISDAIIDVKMEVNSVQNDATWTAIPSTNVEVSTTGNCFEAGKVILQDMFRGEYNNVLTDTFNNFQYGSVKNFPDDGGTVEDTIVTIDASTPPVMTVTSRLNAREPMEATFPFNSGSYTISGTDNANYDNFAVFVRPTGVNTAELYTDAALSNPVNGTTQGTANGGTINGFQGSRVIWSFYAKARGEQSGTKTLMLIVNWKEIVQ